MFMLHKLTDTLIYIVVRVNSCLFSVLFYICLIISNLNLCFIILYRIKYLYLKLFINIVLI